MSKNSSALINYYEFETEYLEKTIELYKGNLLDFDKKYDILIVSYIKDHFDPTPNTLIGDLFNNGINIKDLSDNPEIDLRPNFDTWISKEINHPKFSFKRIIGIEFPHYRKYRLDDMDKYIKNISSMLSLIQKLDYIDINTIAMPILASGVNNVPLEKITNELFEEAKKSLIEINKIKSIYIVDMSERKINVLDAIINMNLQRTNSETNYIFSDKECTLICENMKNSIKKLLSKKEIKGPNTLDELLYSLKDSELRFFLIAFLGRKTLEYLLYEEVKNKKVYESLNLYSLIQVYQKENDVSPWIISYMHTIRSVGNSHVHPDKKNKSIPKEIKIEDQKIFLECLSRILDHFVEN